MNQVGWTSLQRDLVWIGATSLVILALAGYYDAFDAFVHWYVRQPEPYGLEEVIPVFLILPFGLAVFAWRRWRELRAALREIHVLKGILPICASCKRIRDDQGNWHPVEEYVRSHSEARFSHGACPECAEKLRAEFFSSK